MQNRFFLFLLISFSGVSFAQDDDGFYNLKEQGISRPVKSVVTYVYEVDENDLGNPPKTDMDFFRIGYSVSGEILSYQSLGKDSAVNYFDHYHFENNLLKRIDAFGKLPWTRYDAGRNAIIPPGQQTKPMSVTTFEHDRHGRMTKRTVTDTTGKVANEQKFGYDRKGRLKSMSETYELFSQLSFWYYRFSYDNAGRLVKTHSGGKHKLIYETTIVYEYGLKVSENTGHRDRWHFFPDYTDFFENGLLVKHEQYDDERNVISSCIYTYEFDAHGNWTKKTMVLKGRVIGVWERTFLYY